MKSYKTMYKIICIGLVAWMSFFTLGAFAAIDRLTLVTSDVTSDQEEKLRWVQTQLEKYDNHILKAELKMLMRKYNKIESAGIGEGGLWTSSSFSSQTQSGLMVDLYGGLPRRQDRFLGSDPLDIITGKQAIDESLQLGSIGRERNDPDEQLLQSVKWSLEDYKRDFKTYPSSLLDFGALKDKYYSRVWYNNRSQNISELLYLLRYERTSDGNFILQLQDISENYSLTDIKSLAIPSHPWGEMIGGKKIEKSKIFSLVPQDHFLVYFNSADKIVELEDALKEIIHPFDNIFGSEEMLNILDKVANRLGVRDYRNLVSYVSELAFVSEDLDFYPKTEYALIVRLKDSFLQGLLENFRSEKNYQKNIGEYFVLSTSPRLLQNVERTSQKVIPSMEDAKDFTFALSALESRRDGVVYFSESFISKLVGPEYRILARRRNTIIEALNTLQYVVFAYRDLTGLWPSSLGQIADEGYINTSAIKSIDDYTIDADGWVTHREWGNMKNITSISEAPLGSISRNEKRIYENFRDGYQNYWREFFDPIGIGITVSDQILFHTVILPLIDQGEYSFMADIFGGEPIEFTFITSPHRVPAIQIAAKIHDLTLLYTAVLSLESRDILEKELKLKYLSVLQKYGVDSTVYDNGCGGRQWLGEGRGCSSALREKYPDVSVNKMLDELYEISKPLIRELANKDIKKWLKWETEKDVLGFIGNEITFGVGEKNAFSIRNIADTDLYLGLKLSDSSLAQEFLLKIFAKFSEEYGGRQGQPYGYGMFSLSSMQPVKNIYREKEYYLIPTGFVNAYYTFLGDTFYFSISQLSINRLIDAYLDEKERTFDERYSPSIQRGMAFIGQKHNIVAQVDVEKMGFWKESLSKEFQGAYSYSLFSRLAQDAAYLAEVYTLARALPDFDGTPKAVEGKYYTKIPNNILGISYVVNGNTISLETQGESYNAEAVLQDRKFEVFKDIDFSEKIKNWNSIKNISVGLQLTKEGLDSRLSFSNPLAKEQDTRFLLEKTHKPLPVKKSSQSLWIVLLICLGLILFIGGVIIAVLFARRSKKDNNITPKDPQQPAGSSTKKNFKTPDSQEAIPSQESNTPQDNKRLSE